MQTKAVGGQGIDDRRAREHVLPSAHRPDSYERLGAKVEYHDPFIPELHDDGATLKSVPLTVEAVRGADCVVIVTDHSKLDYAMLAKEARALVDTRHAVASRAKAK